MASVLTGGRRPERVGAARYASRTARARFDQGSAQRLRFWFAQSRLRSPSLHV